MEVLNFDERTILSMFFGLKDGVFYTQKEIAQVLGFSSEKVKQFKKRVLEKLRRNKEINKLQ